MILFLADINIRMSKEMKNQKEQHHHFDKEGHINTKDLREGKHRSDPTIVVAQKY